MQSDNDNQPSQRKPTPPGVAQCDNQEEDAGNQRTPFRPVSNIHTTNNEDDHVSSTSSESMVLFRGTLYPPLTSVQSARLSSAAPRPPLAPLNEENVTEKVTNVDEASLHNNKNNSSTIKTQGVATSASPLSKESVMYEKDQLERRLRQCQSQQGSNIARSDAQNQSAEAATKPQIIEQLESEHEHEKQYNSRISTYQLKQEVEQLRLDVCEALATKEVDEGNGSAVAINAGTNITHDEESQPGAYALRSYTLHATSRDRRAQTANTREDVITPTNINEVNFGLVVAIPVEEQGSTNVTSPNINLPRAIEETEVEQERVDAAKLKKEAQRRHRRLSIVLALTGLGTIVVAGITLILVTVLNRDNSDVNNTVVSSSEAIETTKAHLSSLLPAETTAAMSYDPQSAPALASAWLLEDPSVHDYPDWRLIQRFALATFFYATNGPEWFKNERWLSHGHHECDWFLQATSGLEMVYDVANLFGDTLELRVCDNATGAELGVGGRRLRNLWLQTNNLGGRIPE